MINFDELNAAEKLVFNAIENNVPLKEVVIELCDLFINIDNDVDEENNLIYNSKLDKFLKLNHLTKNVLDYKENNYKNSNDDVHIDMNIDIDSDNIYFNKYSIIKAISNTFNIDFALTNNLKTHANDYAYFAKKVYGNEMGYIDASVILEFFYTVFDVNDNYDELVEFLHGKSLYDIFFDYCVPNREEFNRRFSYGINDIDFIRYLYKFGFIILEKNIALNNTNSQNTRFVNKDVILHPDKI